MNKYTEDYRIFPISQSQLNVWKLEQKFPNNPMNNICTSIRIKGRIDVALVTKCINHILEKDLSLRTRMAVVNGSLHQYHVAYKEEQFPFFNFSMTDESGFLRWENTIAQIPLPVCDSPLYQFYIYKSDEKSGGILIKIHHLIADGWSIVDLANRISSVYLAMLSQKRLELPPMPVYEKHVAKEREYFVSEAFDTDKEYWRSRVDSFGGERTFLKKNSNVNISNAGDRCSFKFSEVINHAIAAFCKKNRMAPFAIYCIALAIHLKRMSGYDRTCIGVPIVNRPDFTDKQTGGMFVNTLPFFFKTDTSLNAEDMIFDLTEQWYDLLRHQRFPFSEISAMASHADKTSDRLFDIVLSYQDSKIFRGHDTTMLFSGKWLYSGYQNEQLIIHLNSLDGENRFAVDYDYLTQIYSKEDICDLHNHITKILSEILLHQSAPVCELNLLDEAGLERVLYTFNDTKNDYLGLTVGGEFIKAVNNSPNKAALICNDLKLTYADLYKHAQKIAGFIRRECSGKKDKENIVAICLPREFDLVASMLACSLSDNAWVIVPPELPEGRILHIIKDSGAAMAITLRRYASYFSGVPTVLSEDFDSNDCCVPPDSQQDNKQADSRNLAYVVYTSGSTGAPKGVMIEQGSLVNFSKEMDGIFANGGILSVCNTGFDVFILETVSALLCGRTVVLAPDAQCNDPAALAALIKRYAANCFAVTPSRLEAYISNPEFALAVSNVESIILGGELITGDFINRLEKLTKARIYNQYGASETAIGVSCKCLNQSPSLSAGRPMANCRLYVLDDNFKPLPVGAAGSLYVGGVCVGRGYINNDELTKKSFLEDLFEVDGRMYRTGDLARWEKSGEICILGRCDAQVKLNGYRIEPHEITSVLMTHPDVGQAAVNITKHENSGFITAYYTSSFEIPEDGLYETCAALLPEYMIPAFFIRVDAIPLTPNGKTDFERLPKTEQPSVPQEADENKNVCNAKMTETERLILGAYKKILKNERLTLHSAYFQNGGDSLNALSAVLEICRLTGCDVIKPTDLRRLATPAKLAEKIDRHNAPQAESAPSASTKGIAKNPPPVAPLTQTQTRTYPLTAIQKSVLFSSFSDPTGLAYNMPGGFALSFTPDLKALEKAFAALIASEEVLRTAFVFKGAEAVAEIREANFAFKLESIQGENYENACKAFVRPFDLTAPPLLRAGIWEDNGQSVLLVDIHHIINDGEGTPLLLERLDALYRGEKPKIPALTYKDYAVNSQSSLSGCAEEYWKKKLSGLPSKLKLFKEAVIPEGADSKGDLIATKTGAHLAAAANKFCAENNITPYDLFAAALGILLSSMSGQNDFVIGTPVAGRVLPETRAMLGAFINTLPLRFCIDRENMGADYLGTVTADISDMLDNTNISQDRLLTAANAQSGDGGLYGVMFSMRPDYSQDFVFGGKKMTFLPVKTGALKMDLVLEAVKTDGEYILNWEYNTALTDKKTIELYSRSLNEIISGLISNPMQKIKDLDILSNQDKEAVLKAATGQSVPYITALLDVMADSFAYDNPSADAIIYSGGRLNYETLRTRSDAVAARLQALGVKRGDVVGIYCERTPDLLCGLLGILKCGAAYSPLSVTLPPERVNMMLNIAGAHTVLCDGEAPQIDGTKYVKCIIKGNIEDGAPRFTPADGRSPDDIAQVLFTSGSTGQPKGVMISHRSLCALLANLKRMYADAEVKSGVLCASNVMFDCFTIETIIPLAIGVSVVLADQTEIMTPWLLGDLMTKGGVQMMFSTPSRTKMLIEDDAFIKAFSRVKLALFGGETMTDSLAKRLTDACHNSVFNIYGPAEGTVFVTTWRANPDQPAAIGYPVPNSRVYVLDDALRTVAPGALGEIYIGGDFVTEGYIGRHDLTKAAFLDDPFNLGKRLYRTGDMARLLSDGRIDFQGRRDRQIKLNGQRIELEEVTSAFVNSGTVRDAAVALDKQGTGDAVVDILKAYVVPKDKKQFDVNALRLKLGKILPGYMIPTEIVVMDAFPLTTTGKVDMRALIQNDKQTGAPEPIFANAASESVYMQPCGGEGQEETQITQTVQAAVPVQAFCKETSHEEDCSCLNQPAPQISGFAPVVDSNDREAVKEILLTLWKEVLARDEIDCGLSFFDQGGTSLACMNLLIRYFKYGWEIKLGVFYEKPTLNNQLDLITSAAFPPVVNQGAEACAQQEQRDKQGGVLVTGAAGFLGAHIVYELIRKGQTEVYCLVRGGEKRLFEDLEYYFTEQWVKENRALITAVNGDIRDKDLSIEPRLYDGLAAKIKTVFHCAADVRHYMDEGTANHSNVNGTKNVITFCQRAGAYLACISTLSVAGEIIEKESTGNYPGLKEIEFDEGCFDIGQNWRGNVYVRSKFLAESEVRKATEQGLKAKIIRIGRLVGRSTDGKFQKNKESNYFYNVITGLMRLGAVPDQVYDIGIELTPVDSCAQAAVLSADGMTGVAHLASPHIVTVGQVAEVLLKGKLGDTHKIKRIDLDEYKNMILHNPAVSAAATLQNASMLNSSLALNTDGCILVKTVNRKTDNELRNKGFNWPETNIALVLKYFND